MTALILGGTGEARALAEALGGRAILSLAGATKQPLASACRTGGFGGVEGLLRYLHRQNITALIDATHPFAAQMSRHAAEACARAGLPLLRLSRAAWPMETAWQDMPDLTAAAAALPAGARVFLSVGSRSLTPFCQRRDVWFLSRSIEAPPHIPPNGKLIRQRPPFLLADECALLTHHRISHLVSKNSGGSATRAKLEAAAALGVQVLMVNRPQLPAVLEVATVAQAVNWVENQKGTP